MFTLQIKGLLSVLKKVRLWSLQHTNHVLVKIFFYFPDDWLKTQSKHRPHYYFATVSTLLVNKSNHVHIKCYENRKPASWHPCRCAVHLCGAMMQSKPKENPVQTEERWLHELKITWRVLYTNSVQDAYGVAMAVRKQHFWAIHNLPQIEMEKWHVYNNTEL